MKQGRYDLLPRNPYRSNAVVATFLALAAYLFAFMAGVVGLCFVVVLMAIGNSSALDTLRAVSPPPPTPIKQIDQRQLEVLLGVTGTSSEICNRLLELGHKLQRDEIESFSAAGVLLGNWLLLNGMYREYENIDFAPQFQLYVTLSSYNGAQLVNIANQWLNQEVTSTYIVRVLPKLCDDMRAVLRQTLFAVRDLGVSEENIIALGKQFTAKFDSVPTPAPMDTPVPTVAPTETSTPTSTPTKTPTWTPTITNTPTPFHTPVPSDTMTPIPTWTSLPTSTPTLSPTVTDTATLLHTSTSVPTETPIPPTNTVVPTTTPTFSPEPAIEPFPPQPTSCCKMCRAGKACGDSCIARDKTCNVGPGCACDAE